MRVWYWPQAKDNGCGRHRQPAQDAVAGDTTILDIALRNLAAVSPTRPWSSGTPPRRSKPCRRHVEAIQPSGSPYSQRPGRLNNAYSLCMPATYADGALWSTVTRSPRLGRETAAVCVTGGHPVGHGLGEDLTDEAMKLQCDDDGVVGLVTKQMPSRRPTVNTSGSLD